MSLYRLVSGRYNRYEGSELKRYRAGDATCDTVELSEKEAEALKYMIERVEQTPAPTYGPLKLDPEAVIPETAPVPVETPFKDTLEHEDGTVIDDDGVRLPSGETVEFIDTGAHDAEPVEPAESAEPVEPVKPDEPNDLRSSYRHPRRRVRRHSGSPDEEF